MSRLFQHLHTLSQHNVYFNFQSRAVGQPYSLAVADTHKKRHYFHELTHEALDEKLMVIWGHILDNKPKPPLPVPTGMPLPR